MIKTNVVNKITTSILKKENEAMNILTKKEFKETVAIFKEMINDKNFKKKKNIRTRIYTTNNKEEKITTCTITPGLYQLRHFMFYNIIRNKPLNRGVHSIESEKYISEKQSFEIFKSDVSHNHFFLKNIQRGFPNLTLEKIKEIIEIYTKENTD
jgi:hypothetical protein